MAANFTEEDVKIKKVVPYLEKIGYSKEEMQFENTEQTVYYGKKTATIRSDIIVNIVHKNQKIPVMIVEVKGTHAQTRRIRKRTSYILRPPTHRL